MLKILNRAWPLSSAILGRLDSIDNRLAQFERKIMAQLDDLKTAVANLTTVAAEEVEDIKELLAKISAAAGDNPAVAEAITQINASIDTMTKAHTDAQAVLNPPAPGPTV